MKVAKRFRWEAAHRLPWHDGECSNLHGHSYGMVVELEGAPDDRGIVIDFKHIKLLVQPLVDAWDHALIVAESDVELLEIAERAGWKVAVLPNDTTAENMSAYVADRLCDEASELLRSRNVTKVRVRIAETETCYAEAERTVEGTSEEEVAVHHEAVVDGR